MVHIFAAIERNNPMHEDLKVALVTSGRKSQSILLYNQLKNHFHLNIDLFTDNNIFDGKYDIIFTTDNQYLENSILIPRVLNDWDYIDISTNLRNFLSIKNNSVLENISNEQAVELYNILKNIINSSDSIDIIKNNIRKKFLLDKIKLDENSLSNFLIPERIKLNVEAKNFKDALYKAGNILIKEGSIKKEYIDKILEFSENNNIDYIISPKFSLPHTNIGDYNYKASMCLLKLKNEIIYLNKKIKYVCVLSAIDRNTHKKAIFNLINLLKMENFKKELESLDTSEKIHELIKEYELILTHERYN